jgi:hypothetical protein
MPCIGSHTRRVSTPWSRSVCGVRCSFWSLLERADLVVLPCHSTANWTRWPGRRWMRSASSSSRRVVVTVVAGRAQLGAKSLISMGVTPSCSKSLCRALSTTPFNASDNCEGSSAGVGGTSRRGTLRAARTSSTSSQMVILGGAMRSGRVRGGTWRVRQRQDIVFLFTCKPRCYERAAPSTRTTARERQRFRRPSSPVRRCAQSHKVEDEHLVFRPM